ncbi:hypothetical protein SAMN04488027_10124 [Psychroflexus sediminis]|uniref:Uncharacterized protein n=1 Tax=Psychroflexus sediminis TaxID=470826 RepID=A0A1G7TS24_9FLAO|nr:hypothetical protein SAMN04488027_10124 [Psychroflexus sediminis]
MKTLSLLNHSILNKVLKRSEFPACIVNVWFKEPNVKVLDTEPQFKLKDLHQNYSPSQSI